MVYAMYTLHCASFRRMTFDRWNDAPEISKILYIFLSNIRVLHFIFELQHFEFEKNILCVIFLGKNYAFVYKSFLKNKPHSRYGRRFWIKLRFFYKNVFDAKKKILF
jgi:hypothetical protein